MDKYRNYLLRKGFSENTINSYLFAVRQLRERLGNAWTDQELLNHKDWLATTFAAKTANLRITAINSYLDFTNYDGIRLKSLRIQQKPFLDNVISQQEYELMRDSLLRDGELFWHFVVRFLTCTGARISERGCGRFFVLSYAAQPSLRRDSSGLSHPSERLILPEQ